MLFFKFSFDRYLYLGAEMVVVFSEVCTFCIHPKNFCFCFCSFSYQVETGVCGRERMKIGITNIRGMFSTSIDKYANDQFLKIKCYCTWAKTWMYILWKLKTNLIHVCCPGCIWSDPQSSPEIRNPSEMPSLLRHAGPKQ